MSLDLKVVINGIIFVPASSIPDLPPVKVKQVCRQDLIRKYLMEHDRQADRDALASAIDPDHPEKVRQSMNQMGDLSIHPKGFHGPQTVYLDRAARSPASKSKVIRPVQLKVWVSAKIADGDEHMYKPLLAQYNAIYPGRIILNVSHLARCHAFMIDREKGTVMLVTNA
jgi:hypothetical protein